MIMPIGFLSIEQLVLLWKTFGLLELQLTFPFQAFIHHLNLIFVKIFVFYFVVIITVSRISEWSS